jgi:hypothetical protein
MLKNDVMIMNQTLIFTAFIIVLLILRLASLFRWV